MLFSKIKKIRKTKINNGSSNLIVCRQELEYCSYFKHTYGFDSKDYCRLYHKLIKYLDCVPECNKKYGFTYKGNP